MNGIPSLKHVIYHPFPFSLTAWVNVPKKSVSSHFRQTGICSSGSWCEREVQRKRTFLMLPSKHTQSFNSEDSYTFTEGVRNTFYARQYYFFHQKENMFLLFEENIKFLTGRISWYSQNHRMVVVGRDLCGSSSPPPLPKQGRLQQAAQDRVQVGLEYLQRRRLHNLPGQPVTVLHHPQREEVLPHVQTDLPLLQFVPIAPCPVAGHH